MITAFEIVSALIHPLEEGIDHFIIGAIGAQPPQNLRRPSFGICPMTIVVFV